MLTVFSVKLDILCTRPGRGGFRGPDRTFIDTCASLTRRVTSEMISTADVPSPVCVRHTGEEIKRRRRKRRK